MKTEKLRIPCPGCGSLEVFYSCSPACCFNHVCGECQTTFEPVTTATGERWSGIVKPEAPPEDADPTVACVKCDSIAVYMITGGGGSLVCSACGAALALELTEVTLA